MPAVNKLHNQIAGWDTRFETGAKIILLQPFSPVVIAVDEGERIRWENSTSNSCSILRARLLQQRKLDCFFLVVHFL